MRYVTAALLLLLAGVQAELWFGDGGLPQVMKLQAQLDQQKQRNLGQRHAIERLIAEDDLRQGLEMVEERARADLGMVKPDEILVQYAARR